MGWLWLLPLVHSPTAVLADDLTADSLVLAGQSGSDVNSLFRPSEFCAKANGAASSADKSQDPPDRPLGSAFFGGDRGPPIFGPKTTDGAKEWPNISEPGPDMGDFPNSAFTLPKGRCQIEMAPVTLLNADRQNPAAYAAPFLFRYGLTDDVEFRVLGHGLTSVGGSDPTTGLSPLNFDLKVHLWDDRKEWLIPAVSLEVYVLTQTGSPQFNAGVEPSVNLNFDLPITKKINLEWTVGRSGVQESINVNTNEHFIARFNYLIPGLHREFNPNFEQFSASWAIEYEVNDRLELFVHGLHNGAILLNLGAGEIVGSGFFWTFSPRLMGFASLNSGLTPNLPSLAGQMGFALAL
jgi:hypothetical protein